MSQLINIDQIRAKNALSPAAHKVKKEKGEGDALSGFPSLIINNGLIACIAYACDKGNQYARVAAAISYHLNDREIISSSDPESLRDGLCETTASKLQRATHESLEFLAYLKRFQRS